MCFLGGVMKKIELQQRKVATSEKSVADKRSRLGQIETLINSLVFKKDLQSERERLENVELDYAQKRL